MAKLVKRLLVGFMAVVLLAGVAPGAWAQGGVDHLDIGFRHPSALEGGFDVLASGKLAFLAVGSPRFCNDGNCDSGVTHMWFYTEACNRTTNLPLPMTENDLEIVPLHDPFVTLTKAGNFLVAAIVPGSPNPRLASNPIIGQTWYVDAVRGIGRIEPLAANRDGGEGWVPYKPAAVALLVPPDDGGFLTATFIFRCPVGTALLAKATTNSGFIVGSVLTLGGDMLDLASQEEGNPPELVFDPTLTPADEDTLCDNCTTNGLFAKVLAAFVYDDDENPLISLDNMQCRCLGSTVTGQTTFFNEIRAKDLTIHASNKVTYWEIGGINGLPTTITNIPNNDPREVPNHALFVGALNVRANFGAAVGVMNFFTQLFGARAQTIIRLGQPASD
jgi:hypothetical protein